jgi:hypothetical protein
VIALAHHSNYGRYSAFVERPLNGRCPDDCLTLPSRLLVKICNTLKYRINPPKNLQASYKHVASNAKAMRITSDFISDIRLPSIDRDLSATERGCTRSISRGSE